MKSQRYETNPSAIRFDGPKDSASYVLAQQLDSPDRRHRCAKKPHPWKQVWPAVLAESCETFNRTLASGL